MLQERHSAQSPNLQTNQGSFAQQYRARTGKAWKRTGEAQPIANREREPEATQLPGVVFLKDLDPTGVHNLVAIDPETGRTEGKTFGPDSWEAIASWISDRDGKRNLYFTPNEPRSGAPDKKLEKSDIASIRAVYADLDPQGDGSALSAERVQLLKRARELTGETISPSACLDTGGGVQLFWFLENKLPASDYMRAAEDQGRGIKDALKGDSVQNIDRLMRLPGTLNIPNSKKRARGRTERRVEVIARFHKRYQLNDISTRFPPAVATAQAGDISEDVQAIIDQLEPGLGGEASDYSGVAIDLRERFDEALQKSKALSRLWNDGVHAGTDRTASSRRLALAAHMQRLGFDVNEYGRLLWVWDHAVSHGDDPEEKLTPRELARCWWKSRGQRPDNVFDVLPGEQPSASSEATSKPRNRFRVQSLDEIEETAFVEPDIPLVDGLLDQGALSVMYGQSNAGKSFVALDLAHAISQGRPWAGQKTQKRSTLYVATEGGKKIGQRALALRQAHGRNAGDATFEVLADGIDLFASREDIAEFISIAKSVPDLGLIIVDTLARTFGSGDESSAKDMNTFIRNIDRIRSETKAHVMIIHHSGKDDNRGARGSSALRAAVDTEVAIEATRSEDGQGAGGSITVTKQRDMDGSFSRTFSLQTVTLKNRTTGATIPSCVARVAVEEAGPRRAAPSPHQQKIIDAMADMGGADTSFEVHEIADAMGGKRDPEALRSALRRMLSKKLVVQKEKKWGLPRPRDAGAWFDELNPDPKTDETKGHKAEEVYGSETAN